MNYAASDAYIKIDPQFHPGHLICSGWRIGLGCAGAPAIIVIIGGLVLPDTPNSLIERGHVEKGRKVRHDHCALSLMPALNAKAVDASSQASQIHLHVGKLVCCKPLQAVTLML